MKKFLVVGTGCVLLTGLLLACTTQNVREQKAQAEATRHLGEVYLNQGKYRLALKQLKKAEGLFPSDHILQDDIGLAYLYLKDPDLAIDYFKKALEIKDDYTPARNNLGNAYAEKKEWDKAIEQYKIVTADLLYGTPQFPLSNLGFVYSELQEYGLAAQYFRKALDIKPDFVQALYGLAKTYMATDRVPEAIANLEKAVDISPDSAILYFELARAYALNGDYTKALSAYHKVVELNPTSTLADRALIEAQKIKNRQ
jgi:type IV pilus biogenesis/stability protein PilW